MTACGSVDLSRQICIVQSIWKTTSSVKLRILLMKRSVESTIVDRKFIFP